VSDLRELTIEVRGMTCGHCERSVAKALESVLGITEVRQVSHADGLARVAAGSGASQSGSRRPWQRRGTGLA